MSVNTHQMKALAHVVRAGSISGAARAMGVTQSAVSQHIGKLEAEVGAPLLIRGRDGVQLTQVGQEIYELADELVSLDLQIEERLRGHVDLRRGQLTVIANAPQPALSLIAAYARLYPDITVDFALLDWAAAMDRVNAKQVDVAIITNPSEQKDLYIRPIKQARYVLYTRADHDLADQKTTSLAKISQHTLLLPEAGSLTRRTVNAALSLANVVPKRVVTMTTFPVMKEAILLGMGVGIFLEASSVSDRDLREIPIVEFNESFVTCVVVPKYKVDLRITESFLDVVEEQVDREPPIRSAF